MAGDRPRIIRLVHDTPGRTRLRLGWLRDLPEDAEALADHLAALDESIEVRVRPWTGSVLCTYDPDRLDGDRIVAAVRRHTSVAIVLRPGEHHPEATAEYARSVRRGTSSIRRSVTGAFGDLNQEVLAATGGRLDLGALTGLGFLTVGAAEIVMTRAAPAPPWFNLAWWAYRAFTITGGEAEGEEEGDGSPEPEDLAPLEAE